MSKSANEYALERDVEVLREQLAAMTEERNRLREKNELAGAIISGMDTSDKGYESMFAQIATALDVDQDCLTTFSGMTKQCELKIAALEARAIAAEALAEQMRVALEKASKDLHCSQDCKCERRTHFRNALAATPQTALKARDRRVRAEALREAAGKWKESGVVPHGWLLNAAVRIEAGKEPNDGE